MKDKPRFMISILGLQKPSDGAVHWGCHIFGGVKLHLFQKKQWRTNPNVRRKPSSWQAGGAVFIWGHFAKCRISCGHHIPRKLAMPGGSIWIWNDLDSSAIPR